MGKEEEMVTEKDVPNIKAIPQLRASIEKLKNDFGILVATVNAMQQGMPGNWGQVPAAKIKEPTNTEKILTYLTENPGPKTDIEIGTALNLKAPAIKSALNKLLSAKNSGLFHGNGQWMVLKA